MLGVAVLATVFTSSGGFASPAAYVDGLVPAVWVGAAVLAVGALVALLVPGRRAVAAENDGLVREVVAAEPARLNTLVYQELTLVLSLRPSTLYCRCLRPAARPVR